MASLHLAFAAHGLTVRHFGGFEHDVDLEAAFRLFHRKFDVQLPHAGEQDVSVLFITPQAEGDVFVQQALDGRVDLVFLAFFLGGQGVGDQLRRQLGHGQGEGRFFITKGVAGARILELGHSHNGARPHGLLAGALGFAHQIEQAAQAFIFFAAHVFERDIAADGAGKHPQDGKLPRKGIG